MEIRDIYYLLTMIGIALSGIVWVRDKNSERKSENDLMKQDFDNHKHNHVKLENRVNEHESKIDERLAEINGVLTEIKVMVGKLQR